MQCKHVLYPPTFLWRRRYRRHRSSDVDTGVWSKFEPDQTILQLGEFSACASQIIIYEYYHRWFLFLLFYAQSLYFIRRALSHIERLHHYSTIVKNDGACIRTYIVFKWYTQVVTDDANIQVVLIGSRVCAAEATLRVRSDFRLRRDYSVNILRLKWQLVKILRFQFQVNNMLKTVLREPKLWKRFS